MYVVGGEGDDGSVLSSAERYDPVTESWETISVMPYPRKNAAMAVLDGRLCVVGGRNGADDCLANVIRYDPVTDAWDEELAQIAQIWTWKKHGCSVCLPLNWPHGCDSLRRLKLKQKAYLEMLMLMYA